MSERAIRGPKVSEAVMELLREVMHQKRWHAVQLGEALGKHPDIVRRWLRGERRVQVEDVLAMADLIGVSLDDLFGRGEDVVSSSSIAGGDEIRAIVREEIEEAMLPLAPLMELADLFLLSQELRKTSRLTAQRRDDLLAQDARHQLSQAAQDSLRMAEKGSATAEPRARRRG
jgi:transcriptional regulator with XRE-family HTH domain